MIQFRSPIAGRHRHSQLGDFPNSVVDPGTQAWVPSDHEARMYSGTLQSNETCICGGTQPGRQKAAGLLADLQEARAKKILLIKRDDNHVS